MYVWINGATFIGTIDGIINRGINGNSNNNSNNNTSSAGSNAKTNGWIDPTLQSKEKIATPQLPESLQKLNIISESSGNGITINGGIDLEVNIPESSVKGVDDSRDLGKVIGEEMANVLEGQLQRRGG